MVLTLDNLAHRYGVLPSEAMARATTFDIYVLDVSAKWLKYQNSQEEGGSPKHKLSQQQLLDMMKSVKGSDYDINAGLI
jgi:hypothetical protein